MRGSSPDAPHGACWTVLAPAQQRAESLRARLVPLLQQGVGDSHQVHVLPRVREVPPLMRLMERAGRCWRQLSSVPSLSERGWFHYCSKAWETVTKCTFYLEYERFLP
ncbi:Protein SMG9 [Operophtera brumata]|uniref:Protein SMG9 n=1 Tax=Operophtera brumata TaxID=104452 RepID=A0A0L7KMK4_OPEBR|nr:Protein SMG9 [Operophtera brumata]